MNKFLKCLFFTLILNATIVNAQDKSTTMAGTMLVRMSEIEIHPEYLEAYQVILKEEALASIKVEPGVIAIFPMSEKDRPNQIRIVEIYADRQAYLSHLETPHFKHYKTSTLKMVKSLKLIDMNAIDPETMGLIFKKMQK
ncbi:putative quinol monooxygenase [Pedobacter gandavensis]|uniref:putative quinol monooxygenase n=1 Tax=Pedobacter gandavensis TaxID=2679963 RepID=UPI00292CC990|nr:antibiotic biosynthesis monooxygenase [Pedobacter gandavensis]